MHTEDIIQEILENVERLVQINVNTLMLPSTTDLGHFYFNINRLKDKKNVDFVLENYKSPTIKKCELVGSNIYFVVDIKEILPKAIQKILEDDFSYGKWPKNDKMIVMDYSSPNIAKKFHPGHLRTTILGNFIKNLLQANGYSTYAINYLGDWGKQFGFVGIGYLKYGNEEEMSKDPIRHLFDVYKKINEDLLLDKTIDDQAKAWFADLENGKKENLDLWKRFRELSILKYKEQYKILNCEFDEFSGESFYAHKSKEILYELQEKHKDIFNVDEDGSIFIDTKNGKLVLLKNDGSTLYQTRDIAVCYDRIERFNPYKSLYIVASEQDAYFKQLFELFDKIGLDKENKICKHINFGMILGMSTRKGTSLFLEDIIKTTSDVIRQKMESNTEKMIEIQNPEKTCEVLAVSSLIIQDFSSKRINNYKFNLEDCTKFKGTTGPYLQYTHCRLASIEKKNSVLLEEIQHKNINLLGKIDYNLIDKEQIDIIFLLMNYKSVLKNSCKDYEPSTLVTYLMKLAKAVSSVMNTYRVMGQEKNIALTNFAFYTLCRIVIRNGMIILGLEPLERM